jgi:hypothetical protein
MRVWSLRREEGLHYVKRLGAASGVGEDACAVERSPQNELAAHKTATKTAG